MNKSLSKLAATPFSAENISKSFYALAFVPLILMSNIGTQYPFGLVIPLYGFILLVLKKPKLFLYSQVGAIQRLFGFLVVIASFFAHLLVSPLVPQAVFYGFTNYFVYMIGLFLMFFPVRTLKEAFSPLFLVAAFLTSSTISDFVGSLFEPLIPQFTSLIAGILKTLGMAAAYSSSNPNVIVLNTTRGLLPLAISWACVGFISMYIFSIILVVVMVEEPSSIKTKVMWAVIGVLGTLLIGIIRLVAVFAGYYYEYEFGDAIHSFVGYILFITWSAIFLYMFSKRDTISGIIRRIYAKALAS